MLLEQMSTRWQQSTFWTGEWLQSCRSGLRIGVEGVWGRTHSKHPEVWGHFLGARDSLLQDASCQAEDTGALSALDVDLQPAWVSQR